MIENKQNSNGKKWHCLNGGATTKNLEASFQNAKLLNLNGYKYISCSFINQIPATDPIILKEAALNLIEKIDFSSANKIITEEAQGIPIATLVSVLTGLPLAIAKKSSVSSDNIYGIHHKCRSFEAESGYKKGKRYLAGIEKGDRVVIIDDCISTGGTILAMVKAIRDLGADVMDIGAVFSKTQKEGAERIKKEFGIVPKTVLSTIIDGDKIRILNGNGFSLE